MAVSIEVDEGDRGFWEAVAAAATCNPFSEARAKLDERIMGGPVDPFSETHLRTLSEVVSGRVERLVRAGRADWRHYGVGDRETMRTVFLFEVFHRFHDAFDELVRAQLRVGESSVEVAFADEAITRIQERGFDRTTALRYFAIFYQMRRAYHFIVRGLVGRSRCMGELRRHLWNNVFTQDIRLYDRHFVDRMEDFSTLMLGETGTGKGTAATAIGRSGFIPFDATRHRFAESFTQSFVAINLSQFPESLIESELFGHCKGAFTGAILSHQGMLERCPPHGSVFLDEIGDVSVPIQIKLLQVLQERTFSPVGSHEPRQFRGRVIAATNRSLDTMRREGLFRDDFYYRLCSDVVEVPPLRQRLLEDPEELERLLHHILVVLAGPEAVGLIEPVAVALKQHVPRNYRWPGNVRELEQAVRRILLTQRYLVSGEGAETRTPSAWLAAAEAGQLDADALLAGYCRHLHRSLGSYEAVARRTALDRRTVKKYIGQAAAQNPV